MVFGFQDQTCGICGERFEVHEERLHYGTWGHRPYVIYHFRCVDFDTRLNRDDRGLWASWKLQQVEEATSRELAALRGRTTALYELALRLMSQLEWTSNTSTAIGIRVPARRYSPIPPRVNYWLFRPW
jgi:hypothetical protein